jgi:hypothetical protein
VLDGAAEALGQLAFLGDRQLLAGTIQLLAGGLEGVGELLAAELELPPGEGGGWSHRRLLGNLVTHAVPGGYGTMRR